MWRNVGIRNVNLMNGTQQSSSKGSSWLQPALHLAVQTLAKIAQGSTGFLLLMLKTNYFDRDGYRTFIMQILCQRMKTFLFVPNISKNIFSNETLRWGICLTSLSHCFGNISWLFQCVGKQPFPWNFFLSSSCILVLQPWLKQSFLLVSIPG